jgi:YVTN family beta-propeller protein
MMVANNRDRTISIIDTGALEVVATLPGAADVTAINTGWFESVAFVISRSENKAVVLDLMKLKKVGEIPLLSEPGPGVVTPDGKKLYVALRGSNRVAVIDTRERKVTSMISGVGHEPSDATMARSNNYCH